MPVRLASLRLQSAELTCADLSAIAGTGPSRCAEREASRGIGSVATWVLESGSSDEVELSPHIRALEPTLRLLGQGTMDPRITADIVLMFGGRPLGSLMDLEATDVALIASANCGLVLDVYSDFDD